MPNDADCAISRQILVYAIPAWNVATSFKLVAFITNPFTLIVLECMKRAFVYSMSDATSDAVWQDR